MKWVSDDDDDFGDNDDYVLFYGILTLKELQAFFQFYLSVWGVHNRKT